MSTALEQKRQFEILSKKYEALGQRAKFMQSGFEDYHDGTTQILNHHPEFSRTKAKKLAKQGRVAEFSNNDIGGGRVNREGEPEMYPATDPGDITASTGYIQKFIEGQSDPLLSDAWRAVWAALGNLAKAPTPAIQKARPNANGSTRDPVVYPQNNASQKPQNRSVPISELDKLVADLDTRELMAQP
jgi:hypothetical protein